jgi:hypothetical protein
MAAVLEEDEVVVDLGGNCDSDEPDNAGETFRNVGDTDFLPNGCGPMRDCGSLCCDEDDPGDKSRNKCKNSFSLVREFIIWRIAKNYNFGLCTVPNQRASHFQFFFLFFAPIFLKSQLTG